MSGRWECSRCGAPDIRNDVLVCPVCETPRRPVEDVELPEPDCERPSWWRPSDDWRVLNRSRPKAEIPAPPGPEPGEGPDGRQTKDQIHRRQLATYRGWVTH